GGAIDKIGDGDERTHQPVSGGSETKGGAKAVLDEDGVARRQRAWRILGRHFDHIEARPVRGLFDLARQLLDFINAGKRGGAREAAGSRDLCKVNPMAGMAYLHPCLAEMAVVDDGDDEITGLSDSDRRKAAEGHQLLAIASDDENARLRLRLGKSKS